MFLRSAGMCMSISVSARWFVGVPPAASASVAPRLSLPITRMFIAVLVFCGRVDSSGKACSILLVPESKVRARLKR